MTNISVLLPIALLMGLAGLAAFLWSVRTGQYDDLDGTTIQYKDWWFNCRPSNTEPFLRLNVEAKTKELLDAKLGELKSLLGTPAEH